MDRRERMHQEFYEDLEAAQTCSQRALNALYAPEGPNRGFWYRLLLGRAQSILTSLAAQEAERKKELEEL
jgi:hypothetical protein